MTGRLCPVIDTAQAPGPPAVQPTQVELLSMANRACLLYTSHAADEHKRVEHGGPHLLQKKTNIN